MTSPPLCRYAIRSIVVTMRRSQRIEQAAHAVVNATPRQRTAAIEALRKALAIMPKAGHQMEIDRVAVIARLTAGESCPAIADDLGVHRSSIWRIYRDALRAGQITAAPPV